ncbi:MAG TPA: ABC transporter permease [Anaerolineales bacterium]|nr:ABC transporter permease [Anaerolineales bacterium]
MSLHPLLRAGLRDLLRRPWQSGLLLLSVTLGVAVVVAIDMANGSARRAFAISAEAVVGRATHQIRGGPAGVPEALYRQMRVEWGIRDIAPVVEGLGLALDLDRQPLRILGVDPFAEAPFRSFLSSGLALRAGFARFFTQSGTAIVAGDFALRHGLSPGDRLDLAVEGRIVSIEILALIETADASDQLALDNLLLMDVASAQEALGMQGALSRIDLIASAQDADELAKRLPRYARIVPASEQSETLAELTSAFNLNLSALSLLALVVGMFLIYNSMSFSVVQRRTVLGILRALGVSAESVFFMVLFEAAIVVAVGALLGVLLGWLLGQGAVRLVAGTINDLYFALSVREAPLTAWTVLKGVLLGVSAGLIAAAIPAGQATRVPPIQTLQRSVQESRARRWLPRTTASGLLLLLAGLLALSWKTLGLTGSFAALLAVMVGCALLTPVLTVGILGLAPRRLGMLTSMAARAIWRGLSRTGMAIASLTVALSVTIGISVMISSFRGTVENWLNLTVRADYYVSSPVIGGTRPGATLSPDIAEQLRPISGIDALETFRYTLVESEFGPVTLSVVDVARERDASLYRFAKGSPRQIWELLLQGAVIVSEPFSFRHDLERDGAEVRLQTDQGEHVFPVVGVYYDYATERGTVLMSREVYEQHWDDRAISSVALYLAPNADVEKVAQDLRRSLQGTGLELLANRDLRSQALRVFDRTFAITGALRILAVVVAVIGVMSAIMSLQVERTRELATLQAIGLEPHDVWRLTLMEGGMMGLLAGLFSIPTGVLLSAILVYVINVRSFGWSIQMELDPRFFVQAMGVAIGAALIAVVYPTRRLLRRPIAAALRQE